MFILSCPVDIPEPIIGVIGIIIKCIFIGVPILLIIWGLLDLGKAVISQKEDDIKKNQSIFIKRLIAAVIIFFIIPIVHLLLTTLESADVVQAEGVASCVDDIIGG